MRDVLAAGLDRHVESALGYGHFRIDKLVCLPIRKLVAPFIHICEPLDGYLVLVQRGLERLHRRSLRHTGEGRQISIVALVIDYQQIAVAPVVPAVAFHALVTGIADVERTETVERLGGLGIGALKEILAVFEPVSETGFFYGRSRVLKCRCR